ncbi:hypothetical protein AB0O05_09515 [Streptomyces sp. NPDC093084]|uniref:hypothetical protein n=1 Tax=Streptomyces sp. NPDC093084 TaxID=3155197 RepID=UPI00341E1D19
MVAMPCVLGGGCWMMGVEVAVGYVFAWLVRKAGRVAGRADGEVDRGLDAGMDRLHVLVSRKLGQDPALERAREEAEAGQEELTGRTRRRLTDSLEDAVERDGQFAAALEQLVEQLQAMDTAANAAAGDHIDFRHGTFHGSVQGKGTQNNHGGPPK